MKAITTKDSRMQSLIALYDLHTQYFESVLEGISDEDAIKRLDTKANHISWLAGSIVQQRFDVANEINTGKSDPIFATGHELLKDNQGIKDGAAYPSLSQYLADWKRISVIARESLANVPSDELDAKADIPGMDVTYYELSLFMIYREANCIGQIALWRRLLGYEPMKYM